jgi:hypothetical protein
MNKSKFAGTDDLSEMDNTAVPGLMHLGIQTLQNQKIESRQTLCSSQYLGIVGLVSTGYLGNTINMAKCQSWPEMER